MVRYRKVGVTRLLSKFAEKLPANYKDGNGNSLACEPDFGVRKPLIIPEKLPTDWLDANADLCL